MSFQQDLNNLTRDYHDASWEIEYMKKNPVVGLMMERKNLTFKGGKRYYRSMDIGSQEDLAQDYSVNQTLTHGVKNTTAEAFFKKKYFQIPLQVDVDEELQNADQTSDKTQLQNLAMYRVRKINEAGRFHFRKLMYRRTNHSLAATDTNKYVQGLDSALTVDETYGTLTRNRSAGTNDWWQQGDNGYTTSSQASVKTISIAWLRGVLEPLDDLENSVQDLVTIVGGVLWLALKNEAEVRGMAYKIVPSRLNKGGGSTTQGFEEMILDSRRVVKDPFLKASNNTIMGETTDAAGALERRLYALNLKDWDMFIHPRRNFKLTNFFDQKQIAGGADFELARLLFAGDLVCWHPNRQLYFNHVGP